MADERKVGHISIPTDNWFQCLHNQCYRNHPIVLKLPYAVLSFFFALKLTCFTVLYAINCLYGINHFNHLITTFSFAEHDANC